MREPAEPSGGIAPGVGFVDREIWAMAWPVMISSLLAVSVDLVDIAMVARLGRDAVAAVGYAAQFVHLVRTLLMSVGVACVALMARAIGAGRPRQASGALAGSLMVALSIALAAALVVLVAPRALLGLLDAAPEVIELSVPYFRISLGATLLMAGTLVLESAQRADRNMRTPLLIALVMALSKLGLNLLLIFGALGFPRLELVGAALATVIALGLSLLLYVLVARLGSRSGVPLLPAARDLLRAHRSARGVLRVAAPAIGERFVLNLALLVYFAILSHYGTVAIAAYAIGVRLLAFSWLPGIAFGAAAATLVGQALGAGQRAAARRAGWRSVRLSLIVMAVTGTVVLFGREPLARIFTSDAGIIEALLPFLLMLAVAQPFMGIHFTLAGGLRGAGDTVTPLIGASVGNWALRLPLAWAAAYLFGLSLPWVWGSLVVDHVVRSVWYVVAFWRGAWARRVGA